MSTAQERWNHHQGKRFSILERARLCSQLTIPALIPPAGWSTTQALPTPYQSLGARGVNNLASKLLLTLLPPGSSSFRMQIEPKAAEELRASGQLEDVQNRLAQYEQTATRKLETRNYRAPLFEAIKHLITAGNVLIHMTEGSVRMFRIDQYVVSRDQEGEPLEVVLQESVNAKALHSSVKEACDIKPDAEEDFDLYTHIQWHEDSERVSEYQELNGKKVPDSEGEYPEDKCPWLPLRWQSVPGVPYGRGLCEEYLGDLMSLEGLSKAVVKFAAAASKILFLTKPASTTKWSDITKAESGDAIIGNKDDVHVLQVEKYADFQVAKGVIDDLTLRLSHAFLLQSGTVRNAERVTAEEIRTQAQELEDVLGGVYTVLAQELQLPLIRRHLDDMTKAKELPPLPKSVVEPVIVTGFEALGRNHGVNRLRAWLADLAGVDPTLAVVKKDAVARRLGSGYGVDDLDQLVKSPEELAQEQQQAMAMQIADKAAGPVAGAMVKQGPQ